jgi:hypothetical protein
LTVGLLISNIDCPITKLISETLNPSISDAEIKLVLGLLYSILEGGNVISETFEPLFSSNIDLVSRLTILLCCDFSQNYTMLTLKLCTKIVLILWKNNPELVNLPTTRLIIDKAIKIWNARFENLIEMEPISIFRIYQ